MAKKKKHSWLRRREWFPWFIAAFTVLSANWAADATWATFKVWANGEWGVFSVLHTWPVVLFVGMAILFYRKRNDFFPPRTKHLSKQTTEKRNHLVLFLSKLYPALEKTGGIPQRVKLSQDIYEDIKMLETLKQGVPPIRWIWEMPLRAISYHIGQLETVTIICSKDSISQVNLFLAICKQYDALKQMDFYLLAQKAGCSELICFPSPDGISAYQGYDFEEFDEIVDAMDSLLREFKGKGYAEKDIMIDITGGQKPTSIVGAAMTFNLKIKTQYVQTNKPWGVRSYDVVLSPSETKGIGI